MMNNHTWVAKCILEYLALHKCILADVKASTNADDAVKNICTVKTA